MIYYVVISDIITAIQILRLPKRLDLRLVRNADTLKDLFRQNYLFLMTWNKLQEKSFSKILERSFSNILESSVWACIF